MTKILQSIYIEQLIFQIVCSIIVRKIEVSHVRWTNSKTILFPLLGNWSVISCQITITEEDYDKSVQEVNGAVKPIGLAGIKFLYTDWMDPDSSSSLVTSLDRMVGDYQFTCPVVDFAQYLSQSDKQQKWEFLFFFLS